MDKKIFAKLIESMRGKPVEEILQNLERHGDFSYKYQHTAPIPSDATAPIHDLTRVYPKDVYGPNAERYYGHGDMPLDIESMSILRSVKDRPNAPVKIYRAVPWEKTNAEKIAELESQKSYILKNGKIPRNVETDLGRSDYFDKIWHEIELLKQIPEKDLKRVEMINPTDWVTLSKKYAKSHGEGLGDSKILSKTVPAKQVWTDANSIHELGYWPFAGIAAVPVFSQMDPLKQIGELVNVYRTNQEKIADAVTKQVTQPFGEADEMQKNIMRFGLDPVNLVPGAAGVGLGALEMMGKRED